MKFLNQKPSLLIILLATISFNANAALTDHFVTTWNTDRITIRTDSNFSYNYNVDWDNDGIFDETGITGDVTHIYGSIDIRTIRITGDFPHFFLVLLILYQSTNGEVILGPI